MLNMRRWRQIGPMGGVMLVAWVAWLFYDYHTRGPVAAAAKEDLKREFARLPPPPGSVPVDCHDSSKPGQAIVGCVYGSNLSQSDLSAYYQTTLPTTGWTPCVDPRPGHATVEGFWFYCKDGFRASIEYSPSSTSEWRFGVDLSWIAP